jgi:hypothetical protein
MANNTTITVTARVDEAIAQLNKLNTKVEQLGKNFSDAFDRIGLAGVALGATMIKLTSDTAAYADEISDLAAAYEMTVGDVMALTSALAASGGSAENAGKMMATLGAKVADANNGSIKSLMAFEKMGISMEMLRTSSQQAISDEILKKLQDMPDSMERNARAAEFFGKSLRGVDLKEFIDNQVKARAQMEQYAPSIKTAGDAFDTMAKFMKDLKIAFAVAFEPLFKAINLLTPGLGALVFSFKAVGAALSYIVAGQFLSGVLALAKAFGVLNIAVSANPLVRVATGLAAIGGYLWATTKSADELAAANDAAGEAAGNAARDQEDLVAAIKKQNDALKQVRESLENNWKQALRKYDLEQQSLSLTEDQKKIAEAKAKIDEDALNALIQLKQKFQDMDKDTQAKTRGTFDAEQALIKRNAEEQKRAIDSRLSDLQRLTSELKTVQAAYGAFAAEDQKIFEAQAKQKIDTSGYRERIDLEAKLSTITAQRSAMMGNVNKLSEDDKANAIAAINQVTTNIDLMAESHAGVTIKIQEGLDKLVESGQLSEKVRENLIKEIPLTNLGKYADAMKGMADESRRFSSGWDKAFNDYVDNANNAATQASRIFQSLTQNMEDALFRLFKTGKLGWKSFVQNMVDTLLKSQINQLMANLMVGGGANSTGGLGKLLGFADGGIIPTNGPVIVGERGPEIISGAAGRTVTPNSQLGGSTSVTYNISAVDAQSFKQMIAADPTFLHAVAEQGRRSLPGSRR